MLQMQRTVPLSAPCVKPGFSLVEIIYVLAIAMIILLIAMLALDPAGWMKSSRNAQRKSDIAHIATAISDYTSEQNQSILLKIPHVPDTSMEICADVLTGSCTNLLDLSPLIGTYLNDVPIDPNSEDEDNSNEHSRYFIVRPSAMRFTISAPDVEGLGETPSTTM